jgi:hypothetical protein
LPSFFLPGKETYRYDMCGGAILAELVPARVHRPLTVATLWPAAESGAAAGGKRKAADVDELEAVTDDEEFEAEFQLFVDDEEPSPGASPESGGRRSKAAPFPAGTVDQTTNQAGQLRPRTSPAKRCAPVHHARSFQFQGAPFARARLRA